MEFSVTKITMLPFLQKLNGIVEKKQVVPILSHILISVKNEELYLTGTDSAIELNFRLQVQKATEGSISASAQKLFDICKSFKDDEVLHFKSNDESKLMVRSGKSQFSLSSLDVKHFPKIDATKFVHQIKMSQNDLLCSLRYVSFSMAQQDVRYYLNGALIEIENKAINFISTDGHRMALDSQIIYTEIENKFQIIVPRKGVVELTKILQENDEMVDIKFSERHLLLSYENMSFIVSLVDGRYPDYTKVVPKNGDKVIMLNKDEICKALQRASILSNEKFRGIRLLFNNNTVQVSASNTEREEAKDELALDYVYEELEIGFNVSYLLDAINAVDNDLIQFTAKNSNDSCIVQYPEKKYPIFVVMPMRL